MTEVSPGSIVAAGGWRAPSEAIYDIWSFVPEIDWDDPEVMSRAARAFATGVYEPLVEPEPFDWLPKLGFTRNHRD